MAIHKKQVYLIHSWAGIIGGIGLLILSITGSVLCFKEELEPHVYPEWYQYEHTQLSKNYDVLCREAATTFPEYFLVRIYMPQHRNETYKAYMFHKQNINQQINIYYGHSGWQLQQDTWLHFAEDLHIYLLMTRYTGMTFNFLLSLTLFTASITGFWIYRKSIQKILSFKTGFKLQSLANWHNNIGLVSLGFITLMAATALIITFSAVVSGPLKPSVFQQEISDSLHINTLISKSHALRSDSTEVLNNVTFLKDKVMFHYNNPAYKNGALAEFTRIMLNPVTGEKISSSGKSDNELLKALNSCVSFHFGNFGGITTKLFYSISGILLSLIVITGGMLYFRRSNSISWNKKEKHPPTPVSAKQRFIQTCKYWILFSGSFFVLGFLFGLLMGQPLKSGVYLSVILLFPFVFNFILLLLFLLFYHPVRLIRRKKTTMFVSAYSSISGCLCVLTLLWFGIVYML